MTYRTQDDFDCSTSALESCQFVKTSHSHHHHIHESLAARPFREVAQISVDDRLTDCLSQMLVLIRWLSLCLGSGHMAKCVSTCKKSRSG
jgi:hypothetical protein